MGSTNCKSCNRWQAFDKSGKSDMFFSTMSKSVVVPFPPGVHLTSSCHCKAGLRCTVHRNDTHPAQPLNQSGHLASLTATTTKLAVIAISPAVHRSSVSASQA